jgi:MFS family permease
MVGMTLWFVLPKGNPGADVVGSAGAAPGRWACLRDRQFLLFSGFFSVNLLAYNQLYFALPLELEQSGAGSSMLVVLFTLASAMTIVLQLPVSALASKMGPAVALRTGFGLMGLGCSAVALPAFIDLRDNANVHVMTGPVVLVVLLSLGHMLAGPVGMRQVHRFAGDRPLGTYYGLLATCGGTAVLLGNTLTGSLRDAIGGASNWALLVVLAALAATLIPRFLPVSR